MEPRSKPTVGTGPECLLERVRRTSKVADGPRSGRVNARTSDNTNALPVRPHSRKSTTVVKDINQTYQFISALSNCSDRSLSLEFSQVQPASNYRPSTSHLDLFDDSSSSSGKPFAGPTQAYCPVCQKTSRTTLRCVEPKKSLWSRLFCHECCEQASGYVARYCCEACLLVLVEINYNP